MELSLVNLLMFFSELCTYVFSSLIALLTLVKFLVKEHNAVTDPGFSRGAPTPQLGRKPIILTFFFQKKRKKFDLGRP